MDKRAVQDCLLIEKFFGKTKLKVITTEDDAALIDLFGRRFERMRLFTADIKRLIIERFVSESVGFMKDKDYNGVLCSFNYRPEQAHDKRIQQYVAMIQAVGRAVFRNLRARVLDCAEEFEKFSGAIELGVEEALFQLPLDLDTAIEGKKLSRIGNPEAIKCIKYKLYTFYRRTLIATVQSLKDKKNVFIYKDALREDYIIHFMSRALEQDDLYVDRAYNFGIDCETKLNNVLAPPAEWYEVAQWQIREEERAAERLEKIKRLNAESEDFEIALQAKRDEPLTLEDIKGITRNRAEDIRDMAERIISRITLKMQRMHNEEEPRDKDYRGRPYMTFDERFSAYVEARRIYTEQNGPSAFISEADEIAWLKELTTWDSNDPGWLEYLKIKLGKP